MSVVANDQCASLKLAKNAKSSNLLKAKRMLKTKYKQSGGPIVTFSLPRRGNLSPTPP